MVLNFKTFNSLDISLCITSMTIGKNKIEINVAYTDAKSTWMCVRMCVHLHDGFPLFFLLSLTPETQHAPIFELSRRILCGHHIVCKNLEVLRKHCQMIMKKMHSAFLTLPGL